MSDLRQVRVLHALISDIRETKDRAFRSAYGVGEHDEYLDCAQKDLRLGQEEKALDALWLLEETYERRLIH